MNSGNGFTALQGTPSDQAPEILAAGGGDITTLFVSMAQRHPDGADAEYLRWHTLDHRPEQQRLASIRTSLRVVSTPACREARAASTTDFDAIDHVMTYFFTDLNGLEDFNALSVALRNAGRTPEVLKPVQRGVYAVSGRITAERAKISADVLPWLAVKGLYVIVEDAAAPLASFASVPGIAGVWSAQAVASPYSTVGIDQSITYCFLDDDPVAVAERLRPMLKERWRTSAVQPLLAAPFHAVIPYEWDRYLP